VRTALPRPAPSGPVVRGEPSWRGEDVHVGSRFLRSLYIAVGLLSLAVGFIGAFLPLLPTVPFLLVSAYCFAKGSKRLHDWLLSLPHAGPAIREWRSGQVIRPRAKFLATAMIIGGMGWPIVFLVIPAWAKVSMGILGVSVIAFILTRPSRPPGGPPR
jgi:uncharacterized protein